MPGRKVNLELPTPAGAPLGGHIVQGHVEGVGIFSALEAESASSPTWRLRVQLPPELRRYTMEKGSIAIDGISLTVAALTPDGIEAAIIPHTYSATNIHTLRANDAVNIETDPLAKYAEQRSLAQRSPITLSRLIENGY